jgi:hypothetical protein
LDDPDVLPVTVGTVVRRAALPAVFIVASALRAGGGVVLAIVLVGCLAVAVVLTYPRALRVDDDGFQNVPFVPLGRRRRVRWTDVDSFDTGNTRGFSFVRYTRAGRRARRWFPAGWPAQRSLMPIYRGPSGEALDAPALAAYLQARLDRTRGR